MRVPVAMDELFTTRILEYGKESVSEDMDNQISELENTIERQKKAVETVKNKSNEISNLASSLQTLIVRGINSLDDETVQSVLLSANARKISEKGVQMIQICGEKIAIDQQTSLHAIASCLYNESKKQTRAIPAIESATANAQKKINLLKGTSTLTVQES